MAYDDATMKVTVKSTVSRRSFATFVSKNPPWGRVLSLNTQYPNVDLTKDDIVFGRRPECDVQIKDNPKISGKHCRIYRQMDSETGLKKVFLEDLSTNGTFVNGAMVGKGKSVVVSNGAQVILHPASDENQRVAYVLYLSDDKMDEKAPSGNVTFVFTDVQSSTTLWDTNATAMNTALTEHDRVMRMLLVRYRGYEVKTEGDAFMVTFFNPLDAVRWCIAVQRALLAANWNADLLAMDAAKAEFDPETKQPLFSGLRVRMGIHSGEPIARQNPVTKRMDYFGPVVNMSARISDTAHGGQIVCSKAVYDQIERDRKVVEEMSSKDPSGTAAALENLKLEDQSPSATIPAAYHAAAIADFPDMRMKDLGAFALKGIAEPVRIYQVVPTDLAKRTFPPLRVDEASQDEDERPTEAA